MIQSTLKTRIRAQFNRYWLNPVVTGTYDWLVPTSSLGARGERCAERYLLRRGLIIIERSYQNSIGEIDLIAIDDRTIVFTEVKTRTSDFAGMPAEAVDQIKQEKITRTATSYLKHHELLDCQVRFDVISIIWPDSNTKPALEHFENAFRGTAGAW